jgi:hypothetical protein
MPTAKEFGYEFSLWGGVEYECSLPFGYADGQWECTGVTVCGSGQIIACSDDSIPTHPILGVQICLRRVYMKDCPLDALTDASTRIMYACRRGGSRRGGSRRGKVAVEEVAVNRVITKPVIKKHYLNAVLPHSYQVLP